MADTTPVPPPEREVVWIRGPGLNAPGAENRARTICGDGWRNAVVRGTVLRVKRNGVKHVKLAHGGSIWVRPQFFTTAPSEARPDSTFVIVREVRDIDLGSDEEPDDTPVEEGEAEGAESIRVQRGEHNWMPTVVLSDQRTLDGYTRNYQPHIRGVEEALRGNVWAFFWAFIPIAALDLAIDMMRAEGR